MVKNCCLTSICLQSHCSQCHYMLRAGLQRRTYTDLTSLAGAKITSTFLANHGTCILLGPSVKYNLLAGLLTSQQAHFSVSLSLPLLSVKASRNPSVSVGHHFPCFYPQDSLARFPTLCPKERVSTSMNSCPVGQTPSKCKVKSKPDGFTMISTKHLG